MINYWCFLFLNAHIRKIEKSTKYNLKKYGWEIFWFLHSIFNKIKTYHVYFAFLFSTQLLHISSPGKWYLNNTGVGAHTHTLKRQRGQGREAGKAHSLKRQIRQHQVSSSEAVDPRSVRGAPPPTSHRNSLGPTYNVGSSPTHSSNRSLTSELDLIKTQLVGLLVSAAPPSSAFEGT